MARFTWPSLMCAMNEISNHDHSRFLTRTNRMVGRINTLGSGAAGAPTVYYADEAGQVGWTDPDNRRTYPWGHEDTSLISLYRDLISLRRDLPVLSAGSLKELWADYGRIAYGRFNETSRCIVAVNNTGGETGFRLFARDIGAAEGETFVRRILTMQDGHSAEKKAAGFVSEGYLEFRLPPFSSVILSNR